MRRFAFTSMPRGSAAIIAAIVLGVLVGRASGSPLASFVPYVAGFSSPVYVTSAPGDPATLYVVEQAGTIKIVKSRHLTGTFLDIHSIVKSGGELGLLSMAFSPHYATNHLVYVSYDDLNGNSRVTQYRSSNGVGVPSSARILLAVRQPYSNHKGGQLQFDKRGYLYIEASGTAVPRYT